MIRLLASAAIIIYTSPCTLDDPKECEDKTIMPDAHSPRTVAGYACPICPHCDKEYGPEAADVGPVSCDQCGKWFEVVSQTVYLSEEKLDFAGNKADIPTSSRRNSLPDQPR